MGQKQVDVAAIQNVNASVATVATIKAPVVVPILGLISSLAKGDHQSTIGHASDSEINPLADSKNLKIKKSYSTLKGFAEMAVYAKDYFEAKQEMDEEELAAHQGLVDSLTNKGSWVLNTQDKPTVLEWEFWDGKPDKVEYQTTHQSSAHYYDPQAMMRQRYLDNHGVTEYLQGDDMKDFKRSLEESTSTDYSSKVVDYLTNPNSSYSLSDMSAKEVKQVTSALKSAVEGDSGSHTEDTTARSEFLKFLDQKFGATP